MPEDLFHAIERYMKMRWPADIEEGVVESAFNGTAYVYIGGSAQPQQAIYDSQSVVEPGDGCVMVRTRRTARWIIVETFRDRGKGQGVSISRGQFQLSPPGNIRVATYADFGLVRWDAPAQYPVLFEVQTGTTQDSALAETTLYTRGAYFVIPKNNLPLYVRVRSVDETFRASSWSAWYQVPAPTAPAESYYDQLQVNHFTQTQRRILDLVQGDNIIIANVDNPGQNRSEVFIGQYGWKDIQVNDVTETRRRYLDFKAGTNITLSAVQNVPQDRLELTISASGGGTGTIRVYVDDSTNFDLTTEELRFPKFGYLYDSGTSRYTLKQRFYYADGPASGSHSFSSSSPYVVDFSNTNYASEFIGDYTSSFYNAGTPDALILPKNGLYCVTFWVQGTVQDTSPSHIVGSIEVNDLYAIAKESRDTPGETTFNLNLSSVFEGLANNYLRFWVTTASTVGGGISLWRVGIFQVA